MTDTRGRAADSVLVSLRGLREAEEQRVRREREEVLKREQEQRLALEAERAALVAAEERVRDERAREQREREQREREQREREHREDQLRLEEARQRARVEAELQLERERLALELRGSASSRRGRWAPAAIVGTGLGLVALLLTVGWRSERAERQQTARRCGELEERLADGRRELDRERADAEAARRRLDHANLQVAALRRLAEATVPASVPAKPAGRRPRPPRRSPTVVPTTCANRDDPLGCLENKGGANL